MNEKLSTINTILTSYKKKRYFYISITLIILQFLVLLISSFINFYGIYLVLVAIFFVFFIRFLFKKKNMIKNKEIVPLLFAPYLKAYKFYETTGIYPIQKQLEQYGLYLRKDILSIDSFVEGKFNDLNFKAYDLKIGDEIEVLYSAYRTILFQGQLFCIELNKQHNPLQLTNNSFKYKSNFDFSNPQQTNNEDFNQIFNLYGESEIEETILSSFVEMYYQIQKNIYPKHDIYLEIKDDLLLLLVDSSETLFTFKDKHKMSETQYSLFLNEMSLIKQLIQFL